MDMLQHANTEAQGARGEVLRGRSVTLLGVTNGGATDAPKKAPGRTEPGHKKGAWMQSYCNQFQWLVAVFASEVFFRNRNRWNVSGGYHVER